MDRTHQEFINSLWDLILRARNRDYIRGHFGRREIDFAIPFLLKVLDLIHSSNELSMVQAVDDDGLGDELRVLKVQQVCQIVDVLILTERKSILLIG